MNLAVNSSPSQDICFSGEERKEAGCCALLVCGAERLSGDHNLGGNGEVFERSEGIFFLFFLYVLKNEEYGLFSFYPDLKIFF